MNTYSQVPKDLSEMDWNNETLYRISWGLLRICTVKRSEKCFFYEQIFERPRTFWLIYVNGSYEEMHCHFCPFDPCPFDPCPFDSCSFDPYDLLTLLIGRGGEPQNFVLKVPLPIFLGKLCQFHKIKFSNFSPFFICWLVDDLSYNVTIMSKIKNVPC